MCITLLQTLQGDDDKSLISAVAPPMIDPTIFGLRYSPARVLTSLNCRQDSTILSSQLTSPEVSQVSPILAVSTVESSLRNLLARSTSARCLETDLAVDSTVAATAVANTSSEIMAAVDVDEADREGTSEEEDYDASNGSPTLLAPLPPPAVDCSVVLLAESTGPGLNVAASLAEPMEGVSMVSNLRTRPATPAAVGSLQDTTDDEDCTGSIPAATVTEDSDDQSHMECTPQVTFTQFDHVDHNHVGAKILPNIPTYDNKHLTVAMVTDGASKDVAPLDVTGAEILATPKNYKQENEIDSNSASSILLPSTSIQQGIKGGKQFIGKQYIGLSVRKQFNGIWYNGVVDGFRPNPKGDYWHVTYDDGDQEDIELNGYGQLLDVLVAEDSKAPVAALASTENTTITQTRGRLRKDAAPSAISLLPPHAVITPTRRSRSSRSTVADTLLNVTTVAAVTNDVEPDTTDELDSMLVVAAEMVEVEVKLRGKEVQHLLLDRYFKIYFHFYV